MSNRSFRYVYTQELVQTSDIRQKDNISSITNGLDLLLQVKPIKYDLKPDETVQLMVKDNLVRKAKMDDENRGFFGFNAQELEKVIPEAVVYDDSTDVYGINYIKIIPLLVEAIQEQNKKITDLEAQVKQLSTKK